VVGLIETVVVCVNWRSSPIERIFKPIHDSFGEPARMLWRDSVLSVEVKPLSPEPADKVKIEPG
jgi:hypothetical protein